MPHTPNQTLRSSVIWRFKERFQFSGWLQYVFNAIAALVFLLIAGVGALIGAMPGLLFWPPLVIGGVLVLVLAFDVCTLKLGLRPPERVGPRRDDLDAFDLMRARRSCRSFQPRNLSEADHRELMEVVGRQSAPASRLGTRPVRFEYVAAPLTVWPTVGGHEFLVAIAPRAYDRLAVIDVGRCLQKIVLHATRMGLATCWIGPGADHQSVERHLGDRFDPEEDHIICVCAVGYRSWLQPLFVRVVQRAQHRRLPLPSLFFVDAELQRPLDVEASPFDRFGRCLRGLPVVAVFVQRADDPVRRRDGAHRGRAAAGEVRLLRLDRVAVLRGGGIGHLVRELGDRLRGPGHRRALLGADGRRARSARGRGAAALRRELGARTPAGRAQRLNAGGGRRKASSAVAGSHPGPLPWS